MPTNTKQPMPSTRTRTSRRKRLMVNANTLRRWINRQMDDCMSTEHGEWDTAYRIGVWNTYAGMIAHLSKCQVEVPSRRRG